MRLEDFLGCFVCFLIFAALVAGVVLFIKALTQRKPTSSNRSDAAVDDPKNIFDRVMRIRSLFSGLPPEHWPRVLARLYDDLREQNQISAAKCEELKRALPEPTAAREQPKQPLIIPSGSAAESQPFAASGVDQREAAGPATSPVIFSNEVSTPSSIASSAVTAPLAASTRADESVVTASIVGTSPPISTIAQSDRSARPSAPSTPAPWDMPDPEPRKPRKSLAEWSHSFMEERNIHWGELASGILIVGSALGLVISLRRELQDTIPYFPALLFLMISLAVHYAGVYTLKRWRLRSTSRGLLLISLLLVPLNFLAGVLFNADTDSRRPLTDPWLWIAVVSGTMGTGWITWSAARFLLRKGHWALVVPVMLIGLSIVVLNRLPAAEQDVTRGWTLMPIAAVLAGVYGAFAWRLVKHGRATGHTPTRAWILSGITLFALGNVYALYLMKQPSPQLLSSLSPMTAVWVLGLLGMIVSLNRVMRAPTLLTQNLIGHGVAGLLSFALVVLVAWTLRCPRDLLLISMVYSVTALFCALCFRQYWFVPVGAGFGLTVLLLGRGFAIGAVDWADVISIGQLFELMVNGRSAVMFLVVGGVLAATTTWFQQLFSTPESEADGSGKVDPRATSRQIRRWNSLTAVGFVGVGSVVGLIGAYRPTADFWDSMIGTLLLHAVSLFVIGTALWGGYRRVGTTALTVVGGLLTFAASFETCFGNREVVARIQEAGLSGRLQVQLAFALSLTVLAAAACLQFCRSSTWGADDRATHRELEPDLRFSTIGIVLGLLGLLFATLTLTEEPATHSGLILGSVIFSMGLLGIFLHPSHRQFWCEVFTLLSVFFFTGLCFQATVEQPSQIGSGTWAYWVAGAIAVWCLAMQLIAVGNWLKDWRPETWQVPVMPRGIALAAGPLSLLVMVALGLTDAVKREIWAVAATWMVPSWQMSETVNLATAVLAFWTVLLLASGSGRRIAKAPSTGITRFECLILGSLLFLLIWAAQGARWDADIRGASAVRWLLALGSLSVAIVPWCWSAMRISSSEQLSDRNVNMDEAIQPRGAFWLESSARLTIVYTSVIGGVIGLFLITGTAVAGFLTVGPEVRGLSPQETWLGQMRPDVSYGIPVAIMLASVLLHGISQRQRLLTIAGSYLLRSIVVFQLLLLVVSPHPQLATTWFVHIVQMVSAGMTIYGWVWYVNRVKCDTGFTPGNWIQPIQMHTWFNGALVAGLMLLVIGKYLVTPTEPLGWIQSAGNAVGLLTIVLYLPLAWMVLLRGTRSSWIVPATIVAIASATMVVVNLERWLEFEPGIAFVTLGWCWVLIAGVLALSHWLQPRSTQRLAWSSIRVDLAVAWSLVSVLIVAYTGQGYEEVPEFQANFLAMHGGLLVIGIFLGAARQSLVVPYWLLPLASTWILRAYVPAGQGILPSFLENSPALHLAMALGIGWAWMAGNLVRRYCLRQPSPRLALVFGRGVLAMSLVVLAWLLLVRFPNGLEITDGVLLTTCFVYLLLSLWCAKERWRIGPWAAFNLVLFAAIASWLSHRLEFTNTQQAISWLIVTGMAVLSWGASQRYWPGYVSLYRQLRIPRLAAMRKSQLHWLPILASIVVVGLACMVTLVQFISIERWESQVVCLAPLLSAVGFVWLANSSGLAWQRFSSIALFTLTAVLLSWSNVPREDAEIRLWGLLVQTYWVLGVGYLAYGFAVAHWLRSTDTWRETMEQSAVALLGLATACLLMILTREFADWANANRIISTVAQASLVSVMTISLAISLIVVALVPKHRAVALSMSLRQAHVYAAQGFLAVGIMHTAITLPWLFRFGLQQYWPYIAMGLAFAGIGVWHYLQRRRLIVLAEPLATTLLFFPAVAALLSLGLESQTDRSLVMLLAGLVYGALAVTHPGFWTRLTAFAFGNLALWLFIERYPMWTFQNHPQLWLIPPAVTALIVSRIEQHRLGATAAASVRYLALAVIYVSSTSEIFIQGIGKNLAPPMILASLALLGMFVGMALKVREYIFLGALFLLVAMFTMVWHAQQQLNHVWPWWAFGISLGIGTLVFFAIFEQRRNQRRRLQEASQEPPAPGEEIT